MRATLPAVQRCRECRQARAACGRRKRGFSISRVFAASRVNQCNGICLKSLRVFYCHDDRKNPPCNYLEHRSVSLPSTGVENRYGIAREVAQFAASLSHETCDRCTNSCSLVLITSVVQLARTIRPRATSRVCARYRHSTYESPPHTAYACIFESSQGDCARLIDIPKRCGCHLTTTALRKNPLSRVPVSPRPSLAL